MPTLLTEGSNLNLTLNHFTLSFITQAGPLVLSFAHFWLSLEALMRMESGRVKAEHISLGKGGRPSSRGSHLRVFLVFILFFLVRKNSLGREGEMTQGGRQGCRRASVGNHSPPPLVLRLSQGPFPPRQPVTL